MRSWSHTSLTWLRSGIRGTGWVERRIHRFWLDTVSEFLDVDKARARLQAVRESGSLTLSLREKVAIDMFIEGREEPTEEEANRLAEA